MCLKVDLEYPKELYELHNNYPLAPDEIQTKKEILSDYQIKILEFLSVMLKKLCQTFLIKKSMCFITKTYNLIQG